MLLASLQAGEWQPGEAIPSEFELAARYEVSQGTVRKAIDELTTQNLLIRKQGKGTFVATHHEEHHQFRFLRLAPDSGLPMVLKNHFLMILLMSMYTWLKIGKILQKYINKIKNGYQNQ